jgi:ribosomal protein L10
MLHIQNGLFRAAVQSQFANSELSQMQVLPVGNCILAFSNATDAERPALVKDLVGCISGQHLSLVGGVFDGMLLTNDTTQHVCSIPPLDVQRQMLVGLLEAPAQGLTELLGRHQSNLVGALAQHMETLKE